MTAKPAAQPPPDGLPSRLTPLPDAPLPPDIMPLFPHISRIYLVLENYCLSQPDTFVGAEGYLCYEPGDIPDAPKPDCMVALGLAIPPAEITAANGYTISEIGKPPDFVLEIASMSDGKQDYLAKRETYARFGVAEYWRFDHTGGRYHDAALAGDRLVGDSATDPSRSKPGATASSAATVRSCNWNCIGITAACASGIRPSANTCPTSPRARHSAMTQNDAPRSPKPAPRMSAPPACPPSPHQGTVSRTQPPQSE